MELAASNHHTHPMVVVVVISRCLVRESLFARARLPNLFAPSHCVYVKPALGV